jgi:hypothetical protein
MRSALLSATCDRSALFFKANGMSTLEIDVGDIRPVLVAFTADELADGRRIATGIRNCGTQARRRAGGSS